MSEPLVRIVSVRCQECGDSATSGVGLVARADVVAALQEHGPNKCRCGGRVLIATEPVDQEVGE